MTDGFKNQKQKITTEKLPTISNIIPFLTAWANILHFCENDDIFAHII